MDSASKDASVYTVRMHLALDIREACRDRRAGKGQWTYGFTHELLRRGHALTLYTDAPLPTEWEPLLRNRPDVRVVMLPQRGLGWHIAVARAVTKDRSIDAYIATVSYIVPVLLSKKVKVVPVVHDLIAFQHEPHDRKATLIERVTLGRALRNAHRICTVSETTKKDLLAQYPHISAQHIVPIFAAPHGEAGANPRTEEIILGISTLCPRKNQLKLIEAYSLLPEPLKKQYTLILVGARGWQDEEIVAQAERTAGVEWKNYLSNAAIEQLYARCAVFAYPSLYEGFGLPIVEAMRRGIPVLTTAAGSMQEIAGDAAYLVDTRNTEAIAGGLAELLSNASLRHAYAAKGLACAARFSWKRTVDLFLAALSD